VYGDGNDGVEYSAAATTAGEYDERVGLARQNVLYLAEPKINRVTE
jgi:hypothetical protein